MWNCEENYNEEENRPLTIFPCGHTYCAKCMNTITNRLCPQCRETIEQTVTNFALLNNIPLMKLKPIVSDIQSRLTELTQLKDSFALITRKMDFKLNEMHEKLSNNEDNESMLRLFRDQVQNDLNFEQEFKDIRKLLRELSPNKENCNNDSANCFEVIIL